MKQFSMLLFMALIVTLSLQGQKNNNALANPQSVICEKNVRFTVLTPEMIRMEYDSLGKFTDDATFLVVNRNLPQVSYKTYSKEGWLVIKTDKLELRYKSGSGRFAATNLQISFKEDNRIVTWNHSISNQRNLKGTYRTLDGKDGNVYGSEKKQLILEDGILSRPFTGHYSRNGTSMA